LLNKDASLLNEWKALTTAAERGKFVEALKGVIKGDNIISGGGKIIYKEINDIVNSVFQNPNKVNKIINGSENTDHLWHLIVPDKNPNGIADIVKETLQYGADVPYKTVSSKVLNVTRNSNSHTVQVPFTTVSSKIIFGDAWIVN
jgi:hypothetical protein